MVQIERDAQPLLGLHPGENVLVEEGGVVEEQIRLAGQLDLYQGAIFRQDFDIDVMQLVVASVLRLSPALGALMDVLRLQAGSAGLVAEGRLDDVLVKDGEPAGCEG